MVRPKATQKDQGLDSGPASQPGEAQAGWLPASTARVQPPPLSFLTEAPDMGEQRAVTPAVP